MDREKKYSSDSIKTKWKFSWGSEQFKLLGITFDVDLNKIKEINYTDKILKITNTIKLWKRRYLTPLGKITVIKTLLLPILNNLFLSLPNPSEQTIKQINNLFFDFLWQGPSKIKYDVVIKQYCDGGLRMINLKAFIAALKSTWIRRLIVKDGQWQYLIKNKVNIINISNLGLRYSESLVKDIKNQFWKDVLKSYINVLKNTVVDEGGDYSSIHILKTPIYFNPNIIIGGKDIFFKKYHDNGLSLINDFIKENGIFYTCEELNTIYNIKMNFLQYHGIKKAIEVYLKKINISTFSSKLQYPIIPANIQVLLKSKKGSRDMYNILNINKSLPTSKHKWNLKYNFNEETWKNIYKFPFQKTISTTLQWFQVRIIHRILSNRHFLHKIKIKDSPLCLYCSQEETLTHMLWTCPNTQSILTELKTWLFTINPVEISEEAFLFNIGNQLTQVQKYILLETKFYIFYTKHLETPLSFNHLKYKLKRTFKILESLAIRNNSIETFKKEWNPYSYILSQCQ